MQRAYTTSRTKSSGYAHYSHTPERNTALFSSECQPAFTDILKRHTDTGDGAFAKTIQWKLNKLLTNLQASKSRRPLRAQSAWQTVVRNRYVQTKSLGRAKNENNNSGTRIMYREDTEIVSAAISFRPDRKADLDIFESLKNRREFSDTKSYVSSAILFEKCSIFSFSERLEIF